MYITPGTWSGSGHINVLSSSDSIGQQVFKIQQPSYTFITTLFEDEQTRYPFFFKWDACFISPSSAVRISNAGGVPVAVAEPQTLHVVDETVNSSNTGEQL